MRLRLFGGAVLEVDGSIVSGAAAQRHRLALLALLSVPEPRPLARDRILALLWPESDTERARNLLNQSVHSLRRALGEECLLSLGDNLALAPGHMECDVHAFEAARRDGDLEAAADLYAGAFLDGFFLRGSPEFEQWVAAERERLARAYGEVLEEIAQARERAGDLRGAADAWRRAANHDPLSSTVALGLMRALAMAGDTAAALRHAQAHMGYLRHELGTEPNPAVTRYERELRERPPEAAAPAASPPAAPAATNIGVHTPMSRPSRLPRPARRGWVPASMLVLVAAAATVLWLRGGDPAGPTATPQVIAVLPFRVTGADAQLHYLREGMLDLLAVRLTGEGGPRAVDPRTFLAAWNRAAPPGRDDPGAREAAALAAGLGAGLMLLGEVVGTPERMEINGAILRTSDAQVMQRASVGGPVDSLAILADQLASTLLVLAAGEAHGRLDQLLTQSPGALRAYLEGKVAFRRSSYDDASVAFQRALRLDSTFALAALGLALSAEWHGDPVVPAARAIALAGLGRMNRADQLYVQLAAIASDPEGPPDSEWLALALQLVQAAPDAAEAWTILGDAFVHAGATTGAPDWRRRAAEALDRAIALDSSFRPPRFHRIELAAAGRDTATLRRLRQLEATATDPVQLLWLTGVVFGDSATVRSVEAQSVRAPDWIIGEAIRAIRDGIAPARLRALIPYRRPASTHVSAISAAAIDAAIAWRELSADRPTGLEASLVRMLEATFADTSAGADAATVRNEFGTRCSSLSSPTRVFGCTAASLLALGLYAARRSDRAVVLDYANRLRQLPAAGLGRRSAASAELAALTLVAVASDTSGHPDARLVARLDSLTSIGDADNENVLVIANIALAELQLRLDDPGGALRAVKRRPYYSILLIGPALRAEGRLAALLGDTASAVQAYTHYLALRDVPGQPSTPQVDSVRTELQQLIGSDTEGPLRRTRGTP